jgi:hypothetical protein
MLSTQQQKQKKQQQSTHVKSEQQLGRTNTAFHEKSLS